MLAKPLLQQEHQALLGGDHHASGNGHELPTISRAQDAHALEAVTAQMTAVIRDPVIGLRVDDPQGRAIQEIDPAIRDHVDINPAAQRTILDGLHGAAMEPGGTSYPVFGGYPVDIAGKTGTAERGIGEADQSWYIALAPYDDPKYVVAVTIEHGGFGVDTAAPAAQRILDQLLHIDPSRIESVGSSCAEISFSK